MQDNADYDVCQGMTVDKQGKHGVKTLISAGNPFLQSVRLEQAYVWERLCQLSQERGPLKILDYGTHDGAMLETISSTGVVGQSVGVDVNVAALESRIGESGSVVLHAVAKGDPLPYQNESFDAVTLIGVLEHIHKQDKLLSELHRVLKADGVLIVSVPGQHLFSFLDLGNFKFRFPRLHRWHYTRTHGLQDYNSRYVDGKNGLIGDIETEKRWHEHFTFVRLKRLLSGSGFVVLDADGYGYFYRVIHNVYWLSPVFKKHLRSLMIRDMQAFQKAEIFVECAKTPSFSSPAA